MSNPFIRTTRRAIRRLGKHNKVVVTDELGESKQIPGVFVNPESTGDIRSLGKGSSNRGFKSSAKRLRVLTEDVDGLSPEWVIEVNGVEYFAADHDLDGEGATLIYLSLQQQTTSDKGSSSGWR